MKRKMAVSFVIMALVCALVGGATFAIFTANTTNTGNTFSAGTVAITAGDSGITTSGVDITKMAPGDTDEGSFTVTNTGNLKIWYKVTPNASGALFDGLTPATVKTQTGWLPLDPGASATVSFSVALPLQADNLYQGVSGNLNFTVNAEQFANNPIPGTIQP